MKELVLVAHNEVYYRHPQTEKINPFIEFALTSVEVSHDFDAEQKDVSRKVVTETYRVTVPLERALFVAVKIQEAHAEVLANCGKTSDVDNARDPLAELRTIATEIFHCYGDLEGTDQGLNDNDEVNPAQFLTAGHLRHLKDALLLAGADV